MSLFGRFIVATLPLVPRFAVGKVASRYVAGETLGEALDVVAELNQEGAMATLDLLGEEVQQRDKAIAATEEFVRMLEGIAARELDSNISIKLTLLGLEFDEAFCLENVERILGEASRLGNFVRIDMEDYTTTDATLRIYDQLFPKYGNLGVVLQAYMRRTLSDIDRLPRPGGNVRLCKGIYIEPRPIAWKGYDTIRRNFFAALEKLIAHDVYVGIATHDEYLACGATALLDQYKVAPERYEFQMLYGVDVELRRILIEQGHRLRVYVPYGRDWYPYSIRRLRENPEIARHVIRAFLGGG